MTRDGRQWSHLCLRDIKVFKRRYALTMCVNVSHTNKQTFHLSSFLVTWSPSVDARGPSVVFEAVDMPCPGPFHLSHSVDYIYQFCPLPDPDVCPSIFVCDVEHTSFHFGLCGRKFVLCLYGQGPRLCTICHSWQHTGVVHLSLQADGKVAFEDIPVFGVCRPACHDSSLYLFILVLFLEAVVLSQVHVA